MDLSFATICSGIGAPEEALEPLGWRPVYCSEIEAFPSAVLAHHRPDVPNLGDFTTIDGAEWPVDVLIGGTPCQAFSFAGARRSLADARGNLTLSFVKLVHATRSLRYALWENVPGVLSTSDNAFGCFLGALVGGNDPLLPADREWGPMPHFDAERYDVHRTYGWQRCKWPGVGMASGPLGRLAWRVLDAQYAGLAQRRERVFLVFCPAGSLGDPAAVLFERQGLSRHPPTRGQSGQGPTHDVAGSLTAIGRGVERGGDSRGQDPVVAVPLIPEVAHTLRGEGFDASEDGTGRGTPIVPVAFGGGNRSGPVPVAATLTAKGNRQDFEVETFVAQPVCFSSKDYGADAQTDLSPTLRAGGHDESHANAGVPPAIAFALRGREEGSVPEVEGDGLTAGALRAASEGSTNPHVAVAFQERGGRTDGRRVEVNGDLAYALTAPSGGGRAQERNIAVAFNLSPSTEAIRYAVRRLTPAECARLQGFSDNHSRIPWRGRPADLCPDGPQYKTYGNSMAVPCIRWIGRKIEADAARVDALGLNEAI